MSTEIEFRIAFVFLLVMLLAMRVFFMIKVCRSGGRVLPDKKAVAREGGRGVFIFRVMLFFALIFFLVMYFIGAKWIDTFSFSLPAWLRWLGFAIGIVTVIFWTWTQIHLDTQWSAQLQLTDEHRLITTGPYTYIRHPLYMGIFGWCISLSLLTANWIFLVICALSFAGILWRIPKEEQMMIEAFDDEYKAYMQHTGRFFPRLRKGS